MSRSNKKTVVVMGGGAGALAASVMLQASGSFEVTILEKNDSLGGKLNREDINGFVFDTGPSILTLPAVLEELFRLSGADIKDYLQLVPLDPQWRCFLPSGNSFDFKSGEAAMLDEVGRVAPKDVDGFRKLCLKARELYKISEDNFFFRDLGTVFDVVKSGDASPLRAFQLMWAIEPLTSYAKLIERYIQSPDLRQALEHLPQYVGSSPFLAPAILGCLVHVQFEKGCWYPIGGMNQISLALERRFKELGGQVVLNANIEHVYNDGKSLRGVETSDGHLWMADEYVSGIDINTFFQKLQRKPATSQSLACSGVTVFMGLKNKIETKLAHHNFFFSKSHRDEFRDTYERGIPHQEPTIYVSVPSLTDPSVAPPGKENVFLLIHTPTVNDKTNWKEYLDTYVDLVLKRLKKMGLDLNSYGIEIQKARSPEGIGEKWGTYRGNIYGVASHGRLTGGFKNANSSREFSNLQYAGGTVNPGAGVPMSLMSGMIAGSNLIKRSQSLYDIRL